MQVNKPEGNPKTGRTNSTTEYREEAAARRLGKSEMLREAAHRREEDAWEKRAEKWALLPGSSQEEDKSP